MPAELTPDEVEWIAALRSGEFEQTTGTLHDENGFCCLGVRCELDLRNGILRRYDGCHYIHADGFDVSEMEPSSVVLARWGMSPEQMEKFVVLNDEDRLPFPEIADRAKSILLEGRE